MQVTPTLVSCDLSANFKKLKEKKAVHSAFHCIYNFSDYIFKSSLISICIIIIINSFLLLLGYKLTTICTLLWRENTLKIPHRFIIKLLISIPSPTLFPPSHFPFSPQFIKIWRFLHCFCKKKVYL